MTTTGHERAAVCRECSETVIMDTRLFLRASKPRCSSCGGLLDKGVLLSRLHSRKRKKVRGRYPHEDYSD